MFILHKQQKNSDISLRLWTLGPTTKVNDIKILLRITSEGGKNQSFEKKKYFNTSMKGNRK